MIFDSCVSVNRTGKVTQGGGGVRFTSEFWDGGLKK